MNKRIISNTPATKVDAEMPYDPNRLLDAIMKEVGAKNDAQLCRALGIEPPLISRIRHLHLPVSASLLIRMHDVTDLSIRELRNLMADRRAIHRIGSKHFHFQRDEIADDASVNKPRRGLL